MELQELYRRQRLSLSDKISLSLDKIRLWYDYWEGDVYISFSGGKHSSVLLHLIRSIYPDVVAVFVDTGLVYPENRKIVMNTDNVIILKPKMRFDEVIKKYGYPVISKETSSSINYFRTTNDMYKKYYKLYGKWKDGKHLRAGVIPKKWRSLIIAPFKISSYCCYILKKAPIFSFENKNNLVSYTGVTADESRLRLFSYLKHGCNGFTRAHPMSQPIGFWITKDIWEYININNIEYSDIYNMGMESTGCMYCMFGIQYDRIPNRFQLMQKQHPKHYNLCMEKLGIKEVLIYLNIPYSIGDDSVDIVISKLLGELDGY